jgi:hypothetical protein
MELSYSATFELLGSFALQIQDSFMTLLDVTFDELFGTLTLVLFLFGFSTVLVGLTEWLR